jgi:hypothetical protein
MFQYEVCADADEKGSVRPALGIRDVSSPTFNLLVVNIVEQM